MVPQVSATAQAVPKPMGPVELLTQEERFLATQPHPGGLVATAEVPQECTKAEEVVVSMEMEMTATHIVVSLEAGIHL